MVGDPWADVAVQNCPQAGRPPDAARRLNGSIRCLPRCDLRIRRHVPEMVRGEGTTTATPKITDPTPEAVPSQAITLVLGVVIAKPAVRGCVLEARVRPGVLSLRVREG